MDSVHFVFSSWWRRRPLKYKIIGAIARNHLLINSMWMLAKVKTRRKNPVNVRTRRACRMPIHECVLVRSECSSLCISPDITYMQETHWSWFKPPTQNRPQITSATSATTLFEVNKHSEFWQNSLKNSTNVTTEWFATFFFPAAGQ